MSWGHQGPCGHDWAWLSLPGLPHLPAAQDAVSAQPSTRCPCPSDAVGSWSPAPLILTPACRPTAHPVPMALPGHPGLWLTPVPAPGLILTPPAGGQPSPASVRPHGGACGLQLWATLGCHHPLWTLLPCSGAVGEALPCGHVMASASPPSGSSWPVLSPNRSLLAAVSSYFFFLKYYLKVFSKLKTKQKLL